MDSTLFDKTFRDGQGNLTIAQRPNLPIITFVAFALLSVAPLSDNLQSGASAVAYGAIFTWAWLELFQGVNYFRRFLGLVALGGAIAAAML
jgi:hypothetical protein